MPESTTSKPTTNQRKTQTDLTFRVNGRSYTFYAEPHETLLDVLRKRLGLTGAKKSCDVQVCGSCTVLVDGLAVSACTYLAYEARDRDVLTIEGLAQGDEYHPIQQAFVEKGAFQCGFCTPGMILTAKSILDEEPDVDEERIKHLMRGNLCRCTGYWNILTAIREAGKKMAEDRDSSS